MSQWRTATLGEFITEGPTNGYSGATTSEASGSPTLRLSATTSGALVLDETTTKRLNETIPPNSPLWLRSGDLLVQRSNTLDLVGMAAIYDGPPAAFIYPDLMMRLRLRAEIDPRFIWRYLNSPVGRISMRRIASGSAGSMPKISGARLRTLPVPIPPLSEQRRIAAILDKTDELRAKRRAVLAKLDSLTQSIFLDMFGDPITNPKGWPMGDLAGLCEKIIDCPHATPSYATQDTAYLCVRSSDIQNEELDLRSVRYVERSEYQSRIGRGRPQVGDVIYCREGARFGNAARIRSELNICLGQRMMILRPDRAVTVTEYIWAFLSSRAGNDQAFRLVGGSASPHINIRDIKTFRLPLPPISAQREFARRVCVVDDLKDCQQRSMHGMDSCYTSLQHRAFRGEL